MPEQEVTYTTVRFHKSSVFQSEMRSEETRSAKENGHRESSVPWKLIVIALAILCAVLMVTVAALVTNIFQYSNENHEQQKTQNCHHNCSTMENDIKLKEEMLRNISVESVQYNAFLDLINREQNRWYKKTKTVLASPQHTGRCDEMHWFCYGIKCYYFTMDIRIWRECKQTCQNYSLSFLKIDDKDELVL
ncbi:killer cell lectin-like receptor 7 [Rattus rattus]|uniref:killer cell lectin-like receptor 7 n=1 Tax=Rattus rattus TaxID=10117 RepID=UPI0013F39639|nr:killer cell lectin-like receptor 7 [Rattus rattus]